MWYSQPGTRSCKMHHSQSLIQSAPSPYYCCHGERKQKKMTVPGCDEDASMCSSGSIIRGLIPWSIFASWVLKREGKKDLQTFALISNLLLQPIEMHRYVSITCYRLADVTGGVGGGMGRRDGCVSKCTSEKEKGMRHRKANHQCVSEI